MKLKHLRQYVRQRILEAAAGRKNYTETFQQADAVLPELLDGFQSEVYDTISEKLAENDQAFFAETGRLTSKGFDRFWDWRFKVRRLSHPKYNRGKGIPSVWSETFMETWGRLSNEDFRAMESHVQNSDIYKSSRESAREMYEFAKELHNNKPPKIHDLATSGGEGLIQAETLRDFM